MLYNALRAFLKEKGPIPDHSLLALGLQTYKGYGPRNLCYFLIFTSCFLLQRLHLIYILFSLMENKYLLQSHLTSCAYSTSSLTKAFTTKSLLLSKLIFYLGSSKIKYGYYKQQDNGETKTTKKHICFWVI